MQNQLTNANIVTSIRYQWSCLFSNDLLILDGNCLLLAPVLSVKCDSKGFLMSMLSLVQLIFYN